VHNGLKIDYYERDDRNHPFFYAKVLDENNKMRSKVAGKFSIKDGSEF